MEHKSGHLFSRFIYLDTNIISYLSKEKNKWNSFLDFLIKHDLTIGITGQHLVELSQAHRIHSQIVEFFQFHPSAFIKTWEQILKEEVESHPNFRSQSLLLKKIEDNELHQLISSETTLNIKKSQNIYSSRMLERHNDLRNNYPPSNGDNYTIKDSSLFSFIKILEWLKDIDLHFLKQFHNDVRDLKTDIFKSIKLNAEVIFYKYYLGKREPKIQSDFGDLAHLHAIPYCDYVVMERDLCAIFNQIQKKESTLDNIKIHNIDFIRKL